MNLHAVLDHRGGSLHGTDVIVAARAADLAEDLAADAVLDNGDV